jgi:hypothetical protein
MASVDIVARKLVYKQALVHWSVERKLGCQSVYQLAYR